MTEAGAWFRNTPRVRRLLELETAKVAQGEAEAECVELRARVAELERAVAIRNQDLANVEAELNSLTEATEWGTAGIEWAYGWHGTGVIWPLPEPMGDPEVMRQTLERQQGTEGVVILRREHTAWHEIDKDAA